MARVEATVWRSRSGWLPQYLRSLAAYLARWAMVRVRRAGLFTRASRDYWRDLRDYKRSDERGADPVVAFPQLWDKTTATPVDAHYALQGPWVFRRLLEHAPSSHVDVGSSLMYLGFFSAVVPTTFVDIRPAHLDVPNLRCEAGDILGLPYADGSLHSVSCLHVLEHIGLGRYGDPIDPAGHLKGLAELRRVLAPGGHLYLSVPVGRPTVYFNAHRVFDPETIRRAARPLQLAEFSLISDDGRLIEQCDLTLAQQQSYGCGLFHFVT